VRLAGDSGNDSAAEDFGDYAGRFAGAVNAVVGLLIGRETLRIEGSEARLVAEQRAAGHGHAASEQNIKGGIQPDHRDASRAKKFRRARLSVCSTAEREDGGFLVFSGTAESGAQLVRFHLAKGRLAQALEDFRDSEAGSLFDAIVQIDKAPSELTREEGANGCFAGTHEAGKAKHL
jgi:hypothetical protein